MTKETMKLGEKEGRESKKKYLRAGTIAQLCYRKAPSKLCRDIISEKKISAVTKKARTNILFAFAGEDSGDSVYGSLESSTKTTAGNTEEETQGNKPAAPKTPSGEPFDSHSYLESLPMDVLVRILCHLHHDQLVPVFHVSRRIKTAVSIARQHHFNYTTPDRARQEMLRTRTPHSAEHWPFVRHIDSRRLFPPTPKAPRQAIRPPQCHSVCMKQSSVVLFQDSSMPSNPNSGSKVISYPPAMLSWKSLSLNRVLFYEDDLCHAVAHFINQSPRRQTHQR